MVATSHPNPAALGVGYIRGSILAVIEWGGNKMSYRLLLEDLAEYERKRSRVYWLLRLHAISLLNYNVNHHPVIYIDPLDKHRTVDMKPVVA